MDTKQEIETRFGLLITISLFFPILLSSLAIVAAQTEQEANLILIQTAVIVGLYLLDYLIFQIRKSELDDRALRRISFWLLCGIALFIVPIFGLSLTFTKVPHWVGIIAAWLSGNSVLFVLALPGVVELILVFSKDRKKT